MLRVLPNVLMCIKWQNASFVSQQARRFFLRYYNSLAYINFILKFQIGYYQIALIKKSPSRGVSVTEMLLSKIKRSFSYFSRSS